MTGEIDELQPIQKINEINRIIKIKNPYNVHVLFFLNYKKNLEAN